MAKARCIDCGYVLDGLAPGPCPACGRPFNLEDASTYDVPPRFNRIHYWLPGFSLALVSALILYPLLLHDVGFGFSVSLVLPFCLGTLIGFGCRVSGLVLILLALLVLGAVVFGLFTFSIVGVFCGLIMIGVALGPLILGLLIGAVLRTHLKHSAWSHRWYLPLVVILMTPLLCGAIEGQFTTPYPIETIDTTIIMPVSVDRAWDAVMFYEEVNRPPPILMKIALPRPLFTRGSSDHVGDVKICVYSKGRLVKRISKRVVDQTLAFDVIEQTHIENRSVVLERGSFNFEAIAPNQTRVTLRSEYRPLLGPRLVWRWSERLGFRTLHSYVLEGMRLKALNDKSAAPTSRQIS